jgi:isoamylase
MAGAGRRRAGRGRSTAWARREGEPLPLGAHRVDADESWNFALYSKHASGVTLLLYGPEDAVEPMYTHRFEPPANKSGRIWHCRVPASIVDGAAWYAYRVEGPPPAGRFEWHQFDPDKLLLDPYARAVYFPPGFDPDAASRPGPNAGAAPLGVIDDHDDYAWGDDRPPFHTHDAVIYELHVRGFTRNPNSGVADDARGTFAGVIAKIPYLQELGVTAVELMPVQQHDPGTGDYWGYMPLNFFAPHHAYGTAADAQALRDGFRDMVRALHRAGIEVILDVVYNHTSEGGTGGPVYSYKGIDNSTYYLISDDPARPYLDLSGTGNTLHCANYAVRKLILDSMHYWVENMHVDGFRFDLASIFARRADGSIQCTDPPIFGDIIARPEFAYRRMIAEPWDAAGVYLLGRAFPGVTWLQWNARFRDDVRRFVRGDPNMIGALMQRLYGSDDLFPDDVTHSYRPWQSVNYVTCHDGFTLYDLVSYTYKRNHANGEDNRDGMDENHSWNCGWEGDDGVPAQVLALRRRQARNLLLLTLLANGTPMLRAGDEFLQTQYGNNNPYNQDNETAWLDWSRLEANRDMFRFTRLAIAFRKAHPSLGRSRFWRDDVRWYGTGAEPDLSPGSRCLAFSVHGAAEDDTDIYVMINAGVDAAVFEVQEGGADDWRRVADTARAAPEDFCEPGAEAPIASTRLTVEGRSITVLVRATRCGGPGTAAIARAPERPDEA